MIILVIPTFNEIKNLELLVSKIWKVQKKVEEPIKILFVDDDSPDGTGNLIDKMVKKHKGKILVVHRKGERGLGSAYVKGFKEALKKKPRLVFGMDADLSHDPKYIPSFLKKIDEGFDVVQGSRYIEGGGVDWSWDRILISKSANLFATFVLGFDIHDVTGSYKAYKYEVLKKVDLDQIKSKSFSFFEEILYRAKIKGFKLGEVPIFFVDREHGESKLSKLEGFKFFGHMLWLRFFVK